MAQDAGQAGAQLPDLVTLQRSQLVQWLDERRQFRRERDALAAQVAMLTGELGGTGQGRSVMADEDSTEQRSYLVHVHRDLWEHVRAGRRRYREERDALTARVGQLTRTLRIRESDLAAMLDREQEMAAQVAALTAERDQARTERDGLLAALEASEAENARLWRIVRQIVAQEPRDNELGTCACCGSDAGSWRQHDADCAYALACAALQEATDAPDH